MEQYRGAAAVNKMAPINPDVRLKELVFYDVISTLIRPSALISLTQGLQKSTFHFTLTPQQATEIATNRDIRNPLKIKHTVQVQLRFCLLETSSDQDDCFPPNVSVKVNNKICSLPSSMSKKQPNRPLDITSNVKLSPTVKNKIIVQWSSDFTRVYCISAYLVGKLTYEELIARMKTKAIKQADYTRNLIKEKLTEDADCEIVTTMLKFSLICPINGKRMSTPCRASTCSHIKCFDALSYLQTNDDKETWLCPICGKPALYDTLLIDGFFQEVLESPLLSPNDKEIEVHKDGSWSTDVMRNETQINSSKKLQKAEDISDDLVDITTEEEQKPIKLNIIGDTNPTILVVSVALSSVTNTVSAAPNNKPTSTTNEVDLTLSDSDDELPLRQIRLKHRK